MDTSKKSFGIKKQVDKAFKSDSWKTISKNVGDLFTFKTNVTADKSWYTLVFGAIGLIFLGILLWPKNKHKRTHR